MTEYKHGDRHLHAVPSPVERPIDRLERALISYEAGDWQWPPASPPTRRSLGFAPTPEPHGHGRAPDPMVGRTMSVDPPVMGCMIATLLLAVVVAVAVLMLWLAWHVDDADASPATSLRLSRAEAIDATRYAARDMMVTFTETRPRIRVRVLDRQDARHVVCVVTMRGDRGAFRARSVVRADRGVFVVKFGGLELLPAGPRHAYGRALPGRVAGLG